MHARSLDAEDIVRHTAAQCDTVQHITRQFDKVRHSMTQFDTVRHTAPQIDTLRHTAAQVDTLRCAETYWPTPWRSASSLAALLLPAVFRSDNSCTADHSEMRCQQSRVKLSLHIWQAHSQRQPASASVKHTVSYGAIQPAYAKLVVSTAVCLASRMQTVQLQWPERHWHLFSNMLEPNL